jgi:hypothetical protein
MEAGVGQDRPDLTLEVDDAFCFDRLHLAQAESRARER